MHSVYLKVLTYVICPYMSLVWCISCPLGERSHLVNSVTVNYRNFTMTYRNDTGIYAVFGWTEKGARIRIVNAWYLWLSTRLSILSENSYYFSTSPSTSYLPVFSLPWMPSALFTPLPGTNRNHVVSPEWPGEFLPLLNWKITESYLNR